MCLIVIVGLPGSGADLLAKQVASRFGYRLIDRDILIQRAANWGIPDRHLREAVWPNSPRRFGFRSCSNNALELIAIRAALAAEVAASESVVSGLEGLLLPRRTLPVLRIRLVAPLDCRATSLAHHCEISATVARSRLRQLDRIYRDSVKRISGLDDSDPALFDLVVNVADGDMHSATERITVFVSDRQKQVAAEDYRAVMSTFALETRIAAALKFVPCTAHLHTVVRCDHRLAFVAADRWTPSDRVVVQSLVPALTGINRVECVTLGRRGTFMLPPYDEQTRVGWRAGPLAGAVCCLLGVLFIGSLHLLRHFSAEVAITGLVTDTRCAGSHVMTHRPEHGPCARYCVSVRNDAKYALYDGHAIYVLHDQDVGNSFASRTVTVKGRIDDKTRVLYVHSIAPNDGVD